MSELLKKPANDIPSTLLFGEENGQSLSEHPFREEVDWIHQYEPSAPASGFYLIEGHETAPVRIWHGEENRFDAIFTCIWQDPEGE